MESLPLWTDRLNKNDDHQMLPGSLTPNAHTRTRQISARWRRSCLKDFARENRCVGIMYCWSF